MISDDELHLTYLCRFVLFYLGELPQRLVQLPHRNSAVACKFAAEHGVVPPKFEVVTTPSVLWSLHTQRRQGPEIEDQEALARTPAAPKRFLCAGSQAMAGTG